jgi:hypothetical protein
MGIHIEPAFPREPDQAQAGAAGQVDRQRGRRRHRRQHAGAGPHGLADHLVAGPAGNHQQAAVDGVFVVVQGADQLVQCIVAADVLAHPADAPAGVGPGRGMDRAACRIHRLVLRQVASARCRAVAE